MRNVERTPWSERRSSRHDELCAAIIGDPEAFMWWFDSPPIGRVLPEHPCGTGFLDVLIESADRSRAWLVEVKTQAEHASAGDVIRQLRWYSSQLRGYDSKVLVCFTEQCLCPAADSPFNVLMQAAKIRVVHWPCMQRIRREVLCGPLDTEAQDCAIWEKVLG